MSGEVKIGVGATFDGTEVERGVQKVVKTVQRANEKPYRPVGKETLRELDAVNQKFQQLLRVNTELSRRIKMTGQGGKLFEEIDFSSIYTDRKVRERKLNELRGYLGLGDPRQSFGDRFKTAAAGAAQAGLRASNGVTGGVGGVAANALGTGMSAGFGAGMMGLLGGVLALGVGKLVGAVTEKVKQAEDSSVAYDKLKRTLGDVNVSFTALKMAIGGTVRGMGGFATANHLGIGEAIAMVSRYSKAGGIGGGNIPGILSEVGVGVGMSRAYGLDPSAGVDVLGQARGVRFNRSEQDTRKFALLIGETIGRSGAFSKADEVMEAIGNYVVTQTRASHAANASGYAGMFSSMVGSGIPGLDPAGAAAMLGRINASLSAGGAKGEASQFFTTSLGARRGMDVFDTQLWREGGAFSTAGGTFGSGPVADFYRRHGLAMPSGDETLYGASMEEIKRQYGNNPKMMLQAMANHLGVSMRNAAALDGLSPNQMGDLEGRLGRAGVALKDVNMGGLSLLSRVVSGSGADRMSVAHGLMARTGKDKLNDEERKALDKVMRSGSLDEQKDLLTKLVASRDQEQTQGKDIRDSKVALENMKELMADKLIPLTQNVRDGVLYLAGGGDKSPESVMRDIEVASINDQIAEQKRIKSHIMSNRGGGRGFIPHENRDKISKEADDKIKELEKKRKAIENGVGVTLPDGAPLGSAPEGWRSFDNPSGAASTGGGGASDAMKFFMDKGWSKDQAAGIVANLMTESGMKTGAVGDGGRAYGIAQWHPGRQENFARWAGKNIRGSSLEEQLGFVHYELTQGEEFRAGNRLKGAGSAGEAGSIVSRYYERPQLAGWEASRRANMAERIGLTPMPDDALAAQRMGDQYMNVRGGFDPLMVIHQTPDGKQVAPPQFLSPYFTRPLPNGQFTKNDPFGRPS